jgi:hypothetical protein
MRDTVLPSAAGAAGAMDDGSRGRGSWDHGHGQQRQQLGRSRSLPRTIMRPTSST